MSKDIKGIDIAKKYCQVYQSAEDRKLEFNLTLASIRNILKSEFCFFTGKPLSRFNTSIDRVDNSKGYIIGNVVACRVDFNKTKGDLSVEDIVYMYKGLKKKKLITTKRKHTNG